MMRSFSHSLAPSLAALLLLGAATGCSTTRGGATPARGVAQASRIDFTLFKEPAWAVVSFEELRRYDQMYAISDVHGTLNKMTKLLKAAGLITEASTNESYQWSGGRTLLIFNGDYIDKGDNGGVDPIGVLLRVRELQDQARKDGGRVIALLGNHDMEFLAKPKEKKELRKAAVKYVGKIKGLVLDDNDKGKPRVKSKSLFKSEIGEFVRTMPVAAVVGDWLFAHSGYIDIDPDIADSARKYIEDITSAYTEYERTHEEDADGDHRGFKKLVGKEMTASFVDGHDWCTSECDKQLKRLRYLGFNGMAMGHEPSLLIRRGEESQNGIRMIQGGWLLKLDVGMNMEAKVPSDGYLLKCKPSEIIEGTGENERLAMMRNGIPACRQFGPDKSETVIKIAAP